MYRNVVVPVSIVMIIGGVASVFFAGILSLLAHGIPSAEQLIYRYLLLAPWIAALGVVMYLPYLFAQLNAIRAKAKEVGWAKALEEPRMRTAPWPHHSHPTAGKISWGGMDQGNDILGRKTRIRIKAGNLVKQEALLSRIIICTVFTLLAVTAFGFPTVVDALVFEVTPPEIIGLRNFMNDAWWLFTAIGVLFAGIAIMIAVDRSTYATFDTDKNRCEIQNGRLFGILLTGEPSSSFLSDVHGIQIISYRSNAYYNDRRITLYEANLAHSNGSRSGLMKHKNYKAILKDSLTLAEHLGIPVWDRSTPYCPDAIPTNGPVSQPL